MGTPENNLRNTHDRTLTRWQRLWRCNSGSAWGGDFLAPLDSFKLFGVKIPVLLRPRKIELWPVGTPDMIGFDSVVITPDMVGKRVAVFVGCEFKATVADKLKPEQRNWKKLIVEMGGVHREVRENGVVIETTNLKNYIDQI